MAIFWYQISGGPPGALVAEPGKSGYPDKPGKPGIPGLGLHRKGRVWYQKIAHEKGNQMALSLLLHELTKWNNKTIKWIFTKLYEKKDILLYEKRYSLKVV